MGRRKLAALDGALIGLVVGAVAERRCSASFIYVQALILVSREWLANL